MSTASAARGGNLAGLADEIEALLSAVATRSMLMMIGQAGLKALELAETV